MHSFQRCFSVICGAVLVAALPMPHALAQDQIAQPAPTWSHDLSGLALPPMLAGFARGQSKQYDEDGYNVGVAFKDDATGSWADLFVYRAVPASVAIWGDRAIAGMFANPMLGDVDANAVRITRFTPPNNAGAQSGLKVVAPLSNELKSSGLAIYLHDGWLVKLRMTSRKLDPAALDARMTEFMAGLALTPATQPAPPFVDIQNCAAPLKSGKKAKLMRLDMMGSILLGGTLGAAHEARIEQAKTDDDTVHPKAAWCRDPASQPQYGIYRRGDADDSYLVAIGDVGTSLSVGRYDLGPLMSPSRGFLVTQSDGVTEVTYPPFDRLPQPEQVLGLPGNVSPLFSAGILPGNEKKTTITVPSE